MTGKVAAPPPHTRVPGDVHRAHPPIARAACPSVTQHDEVVRRSCREPHQVSLNSCVTLWPVLSVYDNDTRSVGAGAFADGLLRSGGRTWLCRQWQT